MERGFWRTGYRALEIIRPLIPWIMLLGTLARAAPNPYRKISHRQYPPATRIMSITPQPATAAYGFMPLALNLPQTWLAENATSPLMTKVMGT